MSNIASKITLNINQLKDDFFGKIHYFARAHAQTPEGEAMLQAANEDGNIDIMIRSFGNAIGEANAIMAEFTQVSTVDANDLLLSDTTDIVIPLEFPSNYKKGMAHSIAQALHQLLVDWAVQDWVKIVAPTEVQMYQGIVGMDVTSLRNAFSRRERPARSTEETGTLPYSEITVVDSTEESATSVTTE